MAGVTRCLEPFPFPFPFPPSFEDLASIFFCTGEQYIRGATRFVFFLNLFHQRGVGRKKKTETFSLQLSLSSPPILSFPPPFSFLSPSVNILNSKKTERERAEPNFHHKMHPPKHMRPCHKKLGFFSSSMEGIVYIWDLWKIEF